MTDSDQDLKSLKDSVRSAVNTYIKDLDGYHSHNFYDLFISEVEKPLFEVVIEHTGNNITKAAKVLGMNRHTLSSRLKKHGLK